MSQEKIGQISKEKELVIDASEFGFEQVILSVLQSGRHGPCPSVRITGSLNGLGRLQETRPLELQDVRMVRSGTPEDLARFDRIVDCVKTVIRHPSVSFNTLSDLIGADSGG